MIELNLVTLSHEEKKAVRNYIYKIISNNYAKRLEMIIELQKLGSPNKDLENKEKLFELQNKWQETVECLIQKQIEKYELLKKSLAIRTSSVNNELEIILLRLNQNKLKSQKLRYKLVKDYLTLSPYIKESLEKIETDLDKLLQK